MHRGGKFNHSPGIRYLFEFTGGLFDREAAEGRTEFVARVRMMRYMLRWKINGIDVKDLK